MLHLAYAPLRDELDERAWARESQAWDRFDDEAFDFPETVGKCVFLTEVSGESVGFMSYDPRDAPRSARVGHNCIIPAFKGRRLGTAQVCEVLRRLSHIDTVRVSTGEHPFFEPARRAYSAGGFTEVGRHPDEPGSPQMMIEYEFRTNALTTN